VEGSLRYQEKERIVLGGGGESGGKGKLQWEQQFVLGWEKGGTRRKKKNAGGKEKSGRSTVEKSPSVSDGKGETHLSRGGRRKFLTRGGFSGGGGKKSRLWARGGGGVLEKGGGEKKKVGEGELGGGGGGGGGIAKSRAAMIRKSKSAQEKWGEGVHLSVICWKVVAVRSWCAGKDGEDRGEGGEGAWWNLA